MANNMKCPRCGLSTYLYPVRGVLERRCCGHPDCDYAVSEVDWKHSVDRDIKSASGNVYICSRCQQGHMIKKHGKKGEFWGCDRYPACPYTCNDYLGKPSTIRIHEWTD